MHKEFFCMSDDKGGKLVSLMITVINFRVHLSFIIFLFVGTIIMFTYERLQSLDPNLSM